jgi:AcrR family transcriptional regulator
VPRLRSPERLDGLIDAAIRVFGRVGFARAQMADIAREAGVSIGTVYNYVEGKDALLLLCMSQAFAIDLPDRSEFPLAAPSWDETLDTIEGRLEVLLRLPTLEHALSHETPAAADVAGELRAIVGEFYEFVETTRRGAAALERSAADLPDLAEAYFGGVRRRLLDRIADYLEDRIARGLLPPVPDVATAARFVVESVAWFARHRYGDFDGAEIPGNAARATTVELVVRALTAPDAR